MATDSSKRIRKDSVPSAEMVTAISFLLCVLLLQPDSECMTVSHLGTSGHWDRTVSSVKEPKSDLFLCNTLNIVHRMLES